MIFFLTNAFSLLESYQLIIAKYKANCCKIDAIIQRRSVKKLFLKILQSSQKKPCARVSLLIKLQLKKRLWHNLRLLPVVKLEPNLWNQQNFSSSYFWLHLISWALSILWQNSCKTDIHKKIFVVVSIQVTIQTSKHLN